MPEVLKWSLLAAGALVALLLFRLWLRCQVTYHVGRTSFRIRLFGLTVRRIYYSDVERVSKLRRHYSWWSYENWTNSMSPSRRDLILHRRTGIFRRLLITPDHRYEFRAQIRAAIAAATGAEIETESDTDEAPTPPAASTAASAGRNAEA